MITRTRRRGLKKQGRRIPKRRESPKPKAPKEVEVIDLTKDEEDEVDTPNPLNPIEKSRNRSEEEEINKEEHDSDDIFQQSQKF